jgi:hypothetical protein
VLLTAEVSLHIVAIIQIRIPLDISFVLIVLQEKFRILQDIIKFILPLQMEHIGFQQV